MSDATLRALERAAQHDPEARARWHERRRAAGLDLPTLDESTLRAVPWTLRFKALRGVDWLRLVRRDMRNACLKASDARYYESGSWSRRRRFPLIVARLERLRPEASP